MALSTIQLLPVSNQPNGSRTAGARTVPGNFVSAELDIDCTTGNPASPFAGFADPFSDPAMQIAFTIQWSWDGGTTFPSTSSATIHGQPTGIWATGADGVPVMTPSFSTSLPRNTALGGTPNTYRASIAVAGGPISFGLTLKETTA